ncbi:TorD/DmsD family molecular chaperone [Senegalimassilia anaerobia]|uniref:Dehydrogenase n=1 Tax=Senegalimassilia anaerobia TaxID=1473216 RepID=A0A369L8J6_9ACTN|nr:molecular chaperone TorD family protein [Senegalimassilia anaerobia]RDB55017.1 hypothetical protein C1880_07235 [Senegalimassilia anaerobia]
MDTQTLDLLQQGTLLFTLLGRAFHGLPDQELIARLAEDRAFEEIPFLPADASLPGRKLLMDWTNGCKRPFSDEDFETIRADYAYLFVGTRRVIAPVWESVYFNKDRMVFQHETFEVRSMYQHYGLEVDALSHEPDDHLAYELLFIAHLFDRCEKLAQAGDQSGFERTLADLRSFVVCHPLTWVPKWREIVQRKARTDFYRGYATIVESALRETEAFVNRLQPATTPCPA